MTKQDQQRADRILAFIREAVAERGYPPSVREIAEAVGLASTSAVHHHLTKLEKDGRLNKEATRSRALSLPGMNSGRVVLAPVIGEIAAGQPIHAYEDRSETMGLPSELAAGRGRETFVLRVRGKSMIDDHIDDGGVVVAIERLACLQGQWAPSPYVALWSRLSGFVREQLTRSVDRGEIVKATLMRATLHLVSAREYAAYSLATMEGRFGAWRPTGGPALADLDRFHRAVMTFAAKTPRTRSEIHDFVAGHLPPSAAKNERFRNWFSWAAVATSGLIWEAAGAHFEHRQLGRHIAPPAKLRKSPTAADAYQLVVRRHLG